MALYVPSESGDRIPRRAIAARCGPFAASPGVPAPADRGASFRAPWRAHGRPRSRPLGWAAAEAAGALEYISKGTSSTTRRGGSEQRRGRMAGGQARERYGAYVPVRTARSITCPSRAASRAARSDPAASPSCASRAYRVKTYVCRPSGGAGPP